MKPTHMTPIHLTLLALSLLATACGDKDDDDTGAGTGTADGGTSDGGTTDGGTSDGGAGDGGTSDGGTSDGGTSDGGTSDGGTGDGGAIGDVVSWTIANHLVVCSAEGQWLCPLGQRSGGTGFEAIPCGIVGLDYVWGTTYEVTAEITHFSDPDLDGCGDVYTLVSEDGSTFDGAGESFELTGLYGVMLTLETGGGFIDPDHQFVCADSDVCEELATVSTDWKHVYTLNMKVGDTAGAPLVLTNIREM